MDAQLKRFARLRKLQFNLCTGDTFRSRGIGDKAREQIWEALPQWKARGILW